MKAWLQYHLMQNECCNFLGRLAALDQCVSLRLPRLLKLVGFTRRWYGRGSIGIVLFERINCEVYFSSLEKTTVRLKSDEMIFYASVSQRSRYRFSDIYPGTQNGWHTEHDRDGRSPGYYVSTRSLARHFRNLKEKTYYRAPNVGRARRRQRTIWSVVVLRKWTRWRSEEKERSVLCFSDRRCWRNRCCTIGRIKSRSREDIFDIITTL